MTPLPFLLNNIELPLHQMSNLNLQEDVETILATEREVGVEAYGPGFVYYLHCYDRPENLGLMPYLHTRVGDIKALFTAVKNLWPEDTQFLELDDHYWDALSIYRQSTELSRRRFPAFFRGLFMKEETYIERDATQEILTRRTRVLNRLIPYLSDHLFSEHTPLISMFSLADADNENTAFAPYVFYGQQVVVLVGKRWIL